MIDQKFNKLTVIKQIKSYVQGRSSRARYLCRCDCGNLHEVDGTRLRNNIIKQCTTCAYKGRPQNTNRKTALERYYNLSIVGRCKKSPILNELPISDFSNIIKNNCVYCGVPPTLKVLDKVTHVSPREIIAHGIDRIDSNGSYNKNNCVACCKKCNIMKSDLTIDEFKNHIIKIYNKIKGIDHEEENKSQCMDKISHLPGIVQPTLQQAVEADSEQLEFNLWKRD